eukprot:3537578-Rhodomonas_salina.1
MAPALALAAGVPGGYPGRNSYPVILGVAVISAPATSIELLVLLVPGRWEPPLSDWPSGGCTRLNSTTTSTSCSSSSSKEPEAGEWGQGTTQPERYRDVLRSLESGGRYSASRQQR